MRFPPISPGTGSSAIPFVHRETDAPKASAGVFRFQHCGGENREDLDGSTTHVNEREKLMNLEELSARAQIHDVLLRYCRGLDRVDMDLVRNAFHEDAWVQFPASLHVGPVEGFLEFLTAEMPRFVRTMHFLGNSLIEFDGPDVAHVETYLQADHQGSERHHWKGRPSSSGRATSTGSSSGTACG